MMHMVLDRYPGTDDLWRQRVGYGLERQWLQDRLPFLTHPAFGDGSMGFNIADLEAVREAALRRADDRLGSRSQQLVYGVRTW